MADHLLRTSPSTVHWGYFDAAEPVALTVESGDRVTIETINGAAEVMPQRGFTVLPEHRDVLARVPRKLPGHIMTGPVAVRGARPGHVLQVDIEQITLRQDWGFNVIRPLWGALPDDFHETRIIHIPLDLGRNVGRLPWGAEIPLRPFFGVMGVAPPPAWRMVSSIQPRRHGGNIDNKELVAGTTLYLPIHAEGALFSVGDGHGAQGDGEVCVSAIETALTGTFRLTVRTDMTLTWPMAETPTHVMTMAFDPDLNTAARVALRDMLALISARKGLSREDAYTLCSVAADLRVTQLVNEHNGIHVMLPKGYLA
jgi:acetamidase/formamidase